MISDTSVYDMFSLRDDILMKNSDGIATLHLLFFACLSTIPNNNYRKKIKKNEGGSFKAQQMVNFIFISSDITEEQFSYITSSINQPLKYL